MTIRMTRRQALEVGGMAAMGLALAAGSNAEGEGDPGKPIRAGVIGTGNRGKSLLGDMLMIPGLEVPALCDINPGNLEMAQALLEKNGRPCAEGYQDGEEAYLKMLQREDLDAVIIATPWQLHTPMAVAGMKHGKYVGVEVPAAISYEGCWELVNTYEETRVPCMMLENWSFRRDNLAVLRMIREGLFGEIVHCHCAHSHDCVDHWFFDSEGNIRWGGEFLIKYNRDQYPTHSQGPVLSWMDINCGDAYATLVATASDSKGINAFFERKFGPDHPNAKQAYKQGDIVTSMVRTQRGKTLVINYDMQLPRPYDNRWMIQGTLGLYDEPHNSVYIEGRSPENHTWEPFPPYQDQYDHPWWKEIDKNAGAAGHGGTDYLELVKFFEAVRNKTQTPIDVYDSATMSSIIPLTEDSIARGSQPVVCPDYTRGAWKTRKPTFAV